jgi:hypothetical protein
MLDSRAFFSRGGGADSKTMSSDSGVGRLEVDSGY